MFYIEANIPEAVIALDALRFKQVPFATSLALNRVGQIAKREQTAGIFERFEVRNGAFVRRSVIQKASSKRDLRTTITVRDAFLTDHEEGGIRRPGDVTEGIVQAVGPGQRRIRKIRGRNTPQKLLRNRRRYFLGEAQSGKKVVYERLRGNRVRVVFAFEPQVRIQPRLEFEDTVNRVVRHRWRREFGRAFGKAIATAK